MSNPLTNLLPARARKSVYGLVSVASVVYGIWEATNGNWLAFAAGLVGAATTALAHGNVILPKSIEAAAKDVRPIFDAVAKDAPAVMADAAKVVDAAADPGASDGTAK